MEILDFGKANIKAFVDASSRHDHRATVEETIKGKTLI